MIREVILAIVDDLTAITDHTLSRQLIHPVTGGTPLSPEFIIPAHFVFT